MRILIPVKPFAEAKQRLSPAIDDTARAKLAKELFRHVFDVAAEWAGPRSLAVISRSDEVLQFAAQRGASGLREASPSGLNGAIRQAAAHLRAEGCDSVMIVASDLPLLCAQDLAKLGENTCAIAPDRHRRGTNALLWPASPEPGFHFGENSFARHRAAAAQCGLEPCVVIAPGLGHDIDVADDLTGPFKLPWTGALPKTC